MFSGDQKISLDNKSNGRFSVLMIECWSAGNDYALQLAEALRLKGIRINLVGAEDGLKNIFQGPHWKIVPGYFTSYGKVRKLLKHVFSLIRTFVLILKLKPDIVHFQALRLPKIDWLFVDILRLLAYRVVFTAHNTENHETNKFNQWVFNRIYKESKLIFVQTRFSKEFLQNKLGLPNHQVFIAPRGTVLMSYERLADRESLCNPRKFWSFSPNHEIVLMFGLLREYKGLDVLILALSLLKERRPNLRIFVAGYCPDKRLLQRYEKLVRELRVENKIRFVVDRKIPDELVASVFRASDAIVLPYKRVDQSAVLVTAYAHRMPVIAAAVGGFLENVKDGKTGYLFENDNFEDLADKIDLVFSNSDNLATMGENAFEFAKANYVWRNTALATIKGYERMIFNTN